ncbi:twin-arginine translocation signal domain-containing protein, partial [Stenotrophomonas pictorum]
MSTTSSPPAPARRDFLRRSALLGIAAGLGSPALAGT